ncbi:MAG: peptide-methionine (R)-S-oxide reductase [Candidatus Heimdallarchaeota archaeon]|nr:peptide-methionine (R)-S-oxide reductase [Candidatus Heimdallarchaeota archaeon]
MKKDKKIPTTDDEWKKILAPEQFFVLRQSGTEQAFSGKFWNHFEQGEYKCGGCGTVLFKSDQKFHSNCGWPSFANNEEGTVITRKDTSHGMIRKEVLCKTCGGHLGHVFNDGPKEMGGLRYCINSLSLEFSNH